MTEMQVGFDVLNRFKKWMKARARLDHLLLNYGLSEEELDKLWDDWRKSEYGAEHFAESAAIRICKKAREKEQQEEPEAQAAE